VIHKDKCKGKDKIIPMLKVSTTSEGVLGVELQLHSFFDDSF